MPFFVVFLISLPFFFLTTGQNFGRLWKGGLIGVGIMIIADTIGHLMNLYHYKSPIMLGGYLPILHFVNIFLLSMIYLNWLPPLWPKRILYTVYLSVLAIAIEGLMLQAGAVTYTNWQLSSSYILDMVGLLLLAHFNDFVNKVKTV
ncbi:MAG: hypothetical protein PHO01_06475 [Desulfotomaculaceae bacterium]|nr:hypothetical protein [Desulfotomaculaceae bacterium]